MEIHTPAAGQAIVLSEDPMTIVHDDVVTSEECAHFIEVAHQTGLQRALVAARGRDRCRMGEPVATRGWLTITTRLWLLSQSASLR